MDFIPESFVNNFDRFAFEFNRVEQQKSMTIFHLHDRYEVYYLLSGKRDYFIDNRTYHVNPGNLVLINKHVIHRTMGESDRVGYERALFYFDDCFRGLTKKLFPHLNLFSIFDMDMHVFSLTPEDQAMMEKYIARIANECLNQRENHKEYMKVLMLDFLFFINRSVANLLGEAPQTTNKKFAKISDILAYINTNYMEDLTLPTITEEFFISTSSFTKTFKEATGFSFVEYLNNLRIKHAQYMLRGTDLSISDIAEKVGYKSATHFGRVFKKFTGQSPLSYRKRK